MKLILALGNPGAEYAETRHNTGFMVADSFAYSHGARFSEKPKFFAYVGECVVADEKVIIAKPTTFYNQVGRSARALIDFYKLAPEDVLVIHDDLALPLGTIRVRSKGSDAGNNGIKSLNIHIGPQYARLRIGIHVDERTGNDADFVLSRFTSNEIHTLKESIIPTATQLTANFLEDKLEDTSYTIKP
jgi:PTH1 family peptidyl-tRNA hydrolase